MEQSNLPVWSKLFAGILLILFTTLPAMIIFAYWPERQPYEKENIQPLYINQAFHVRLANIKDTVCTSDTTFRKEHVKAAGNDTVNRVDVVETACSANISDYPFNTNDLIHLNTLIFILVAASGFLGNMVYLATSFTTFVGALKFERSWLLWYFVKPFTAAALALGLYFVFSAGYLNSSSNAKNVNLFGAITIAFLTGLFTDRATLKVKEVVNTIFGIKDGGGRPDPIDTDAPVVTSLIPEELQKGKDHIIVLSGQRLDKHKLFIRIGDQEITEQALTPNSISFFYRVPDEIPTGAVVTLVVKDEKGGDVFTWEFKVLA